MNPRGEFEVEKNVQILNNYGKKSNPRGEGRVGENIKSVYIKKIGKNIALKNIQYLSPWNIY